MSAVVKPVAVYALGGPRHGQGHLESEWTEAVAASARVGGRLGRYLAPIPYVPALHGTMPVIKRGSGDAGRFVPLDSEYVVRVAVWLDPS